MAHTGMDQAAGIKHFERFDDGAGVLGVDLERRGELAADESADAQAQVLDVGVGAQQGDGDRAAEGRRRR
ncbi:hypothetical protein nbrc107697_26620 [Gordonia crocea]|uniref:Uncharacterized protein n=1 Tax=Gordonia crocea TaxID=589162 RepID=A0A7I9V0G0_9ACTN|nr:hypothetical protein nbrc107697_26620 [Gordonia crocea]